MYVNSATSTSRKSGFARIACVAGLTAVLVGGSCLGVAPCSAYAATAQTETELAALTQQVNSAATTYQQATDRVNELNEQISEMADEILDFEQNKLPEQQQKASDAAANLYKLHVASPNVMSMLLNSASLGDLITQGKYLTDNTAELERLNAMHEELEAKMEELSSAKDEAEQEQQKASDALTSAQSAQAQMAARAQSEDAAEAEAARKAAEEAAATTAQMQQQGSVSNSNGSSQGSNAGSAGSAGSGSSTQQPSGTGGSSSGTTSTSSWKSGVASYYGIGDGFMGGTTASGAIVTESSMGVAMLNVPLGTYVEISYGGRSVIAVVNDRGPYVHGRVIDMKSVVARALCFLSVGVGTVQYRFL